MARGTCWQGYEQKGFKRKGNKSVPNCVKKANKGKFMDESEAHESKESKAQEARETRLEKKGYVETTSGKMKKVKKASLGALIGIGADNLLKNSDTARSITKNLGIGGKLLGSYYDKKADSKDKTTGAEQTKQVTAKRMGGMVRGGRAEIKGTRPAKLS